jgi:AcrR family transcriptional regulator
MNSGNRLSGQKAQGRSFIEEARRAQIAYATVDTLAELGYVRASLAQIARRAGISTSLILYHFQDKDELMRQTLTGILTTWSEYVHAQIAPCTTATEKLHVYVEANLACMGTRPNQFAAMIEIMFNARDEAGALLYRGDEYDPALRELEALLEEGQRRGEFRPLDVGNTAIAIRGTIDQFLGLLTRQPNVNLEDYTAQLIEFIDNGIAREQANEHHV